MVEVSKNKPSLPNLFSYLDYRQFLKDYTQGLKQSFDFNLRDFAERAQLKSPGYLKMVTDGRRNLTKKSTRKFALALSLKGREKNYFEILVEYNQTENPDEKKFLFDELNRLRPRSEEFLKEKRYARYFSNYHYVCIREMVTLENFREDYKWIAKSCLPPISPTQARHAVRTLLELGLLEKTPEGKLVQTEKFIHTQDKNTASAETFHFHEAVIDKARQALIHLGQKERSYYALTLPLPRKMFRDIIEEFSKFRDRIVEKTNHEKSALEEVYQINFQLFPVTKKIAEG